MKNVAAAFVILVMIFSQGCEASKKKDGETVREAQDLKPERPFREACPIRFIQVLPEYVVDSELYIQSGARTAFTATAYDWEGRPVPADFSWHFRYPSSEDPRQAGLGHRLEVAGNNRAVLVVEGTTGGRFYVTATARDCFVGPPQHQRPVYGSAVVEVFPKPGAEATCGPLRLMSGLKDRMYKTVLASDKANLVAEVYADKKHGLRVRFNINGKWDFHKRPLYYDRSIEPQGGMKRGYKANLSIYPDRGTNRVYYELLQGGRLICTSRVQEFYAK